MTSAELENLVRVRQLKREPAVASEVRGLLHSGEARLADAGNPALSLASLRPAAAADIEEIWSWYESRRAGLGDEFLGVVGETATFAATC